jgi:hypothetical protein
VEVALRKLLAREYELNHWARWLLAETLHEIQQDTDSGIKDEYTIREIPSGNAEWRRSAPDGHGGNPHAARTDLMSKINQVSMAVILAPATAILAAVA